MKTQLNETGVYIDDSERAGLHRRKRDKMADKSEKTGRKSCFSSYGHGYCLGYCCSTDGFHIKQQ